MEMKAINQNEKDNALLPARLLCDQAILDDPNGIYADEVRKFQGIPGIECTPGGRFFTVFYTGTENEGAGNFLLLQQSEDGEHYAKPFMAVIPPAENTRCFDPCLWLSPDGKLRLFWAQSCGWYDGRNGVWCSVCDQPDADNVQFSEPVHIANGIMMNKPTVLSSGEWLLPCAVWAVCNSELNFLPNERFSNVYRSTDSGETYKLLGHSDVKDRGFDEHMVYERRDGSLVMYVRTKSGIGEAFSNDKGVSWHGERDSKLGGPNSRFYVGRLKSGRLLLVNHVNFSSRNNLTAMLSEDDGATWNTGIQLDARNDVSYPDVCESPDGFIHIIYDYNRTKEKEILVAKLREEDILTGKLVSDGAKLGILVNNATGR